MEYYGSCLNQIERKIYNKILDALQRRLLFVKVEVVTDIKVLKKCISAVQYDYANLFYVDFSYYTYVAYSDGWEYRPQYLYEKEEMLRKQKIIDELICRIGFELKKRNLLSIYQKCGYIHSYLVRNCTYDHAALDDSDKRRIAYTIEGPLIEKTGVCQGIALAYRLIRMNCSIEAIVVKGVSLRPGTTNYGGHAWNLIRVGESAAQVDTTWDMCLTLKEWPIRYDYFFLPDIEMMRDHQYVGYPICRKLNSSYFERNQSQFKKMKDLDRFIERFFKSNKNLDNPGTYFLQFKMTNQKETAEEIQKHVEDLIRKSTDKSYSYSVSTNKQQSVFVYKIEIKRQ